MAYSKKTAELVMAFVASVTGIFATDAPSAMPDGPGKVTAKVADKNVEAREASLPCQLKLINGVSTMVCNN